MAERKPLLLEAVENLLETVAEDAIRFRLKDQALLRAVTSDSSDAPPNRSTPAEESAKQSPDKQRE